MKSLLLVLPAALLSVSLSAAAATHGPVVSSGRSVGQNAREAWFRGSIGEILEGRAATPSRRQGSAPSQR